MFKLKNYNSKISILIYFEGTGLCHYGQSLVSSNARRMKSASCEIFELRNSCGMKSSINVIVAERNLRGINPREKKSSRNRTATVFSIPIFSLVWLVPMACAEWVKYAAIRSLSLCKCQTRCADYYGTEKNMFRGP